MMILHVLLFILPFLANVQADTKASFSTMMESFHRAKVIFPDSLIIDRQVKSSAPEIMHSALKRMGPVYKDKIIPLLKSIKLKSLGPEKLHSVKNRKTPLDLQKNIFESTIKTLRFNSAESESIPMNLLNSVLKLVTPLQKEKRISSDSSIKSMKLKSYESLDLHSTLNLTLQKEESLESTHEETQQNILNLTRSSVYKPQLSEDELLQLMHVLNLKRVDPEVSMDAIELITTKGFPVESYYVTTDDGYILNVLRIPHGRNNSHSEGPKPVVFLQHGFLGSCTNFLTNPVNESLAYILADAGADVWLGNSRGNFYSTNHTKMTPKDSAFWNFSWDEMAKYDLPATIKFILSKTGNDQIYYVGHSQGTTIGFVQFSEDDELASHIKHFIALAPIAEIWHTTSLLKIIVPSAKELAYIFDKLGHGKLNLKPSLMKFFAHDICDKWGAVVCANVLFSFCGYDFSSFNISRLPIYISHNPAGTSVKTFLHWAQAVHSEKFQAYDYGSKEENMKHYKQSTPPQYNPKKIAVPVAIFRGDHDELADIHDIEWLLPQLHVSHDVRIKHYAHLDFIWAFDSPSLIYGKILDIVFS